MFGMDGRRLWSSLKGHYAVHFQDEPSIAYSQTNLCETIKTITSAEPEIVGISEILEGQEGEISEYLKQEKLKHYCFGSGHRTKYSNLTIKIALASRYPLTVCNDGEYPLHNEMGGGGGYLHCFVPDLNIDLFCVHLALPTKRELYQQQLRFLSEQVGKCANDVILMGDFNYSAGHFLKNFSSLTLLSQQLKTCSMTPGLHQLKFEAIDHILGRGFGTIDLGTICGRSDHRLIWVKLKET